MEIKINIAGKHPTVVGSPIIVCGNSDYTIDFDFDAEWDGVAYKTARFVWISGDQVKFKDVTFGAEPVPVPILSGTKEVRVGVYAGDLQTTTPARIPCELSILCGTDQVEEEITENQYNQIMALLNAEGVGYLAAIKQNKLGWLDVDNSEAILEAMWRGTYQGVEDESNESEYVPSYLDMTDRTTGINYRIYVDNGKVYLEEVTE